MLCHRAINGGLWPWANISVEPHPGALPDSPRRAGYALNLMLQRFINPPGDVARVERFGRSFGPGDEIMYGVNEY